MCPPAVELPSTAEPARLISFPPKNAAQPPRQPVGRPTSSLRPGAIFAATVLAAVALAALLDPNLLSLGLGDILRSHDGDHPGQHEAMLDGLKLVIASGIGLFVTVVSRANRHRPMPRSLEQSQVLLCVAGAVVMMLVGNSLARAFGVAGAASIVRFRTPIDDPKDATVLFLLMAMGMAVGLGALAFAITGTAALAALLIGLHKAQQPSARFALLDLTANTPDFPCDAVHAVFERCGISSETRETVLAPLARVKYAVTVPGSMSFDAVGAELARATNNALTSMTWETKKGT